MSDKLKLFVIGTTFLCLKFFQCSRCFCTAQVLVHALKPFAVHSTCSIWEAPPKKGRKCMNRRLFWGRAERGPNHHKRRLRRSTPHPYLAGEENLKWFDHVIMILEAIKVGKIGVWISFVKDFPAKCNLHLAGKLLTNEIQNFPNPNLANFDGL